MKILINLGATENIQSKIDSRRTLMKKLTNV